MDSRYDYRAIREAREAQQWSIRELVERCKTLGLEVTETTVCNWETGNTTPDADKLDILASALGIKVGSFYTEDA